MGNLGLQMYSIRALTKGKMLSVLGNVKKMGFDGVEFAGYDDLDAKVLATALKDNGLVVAGSHIQLPAFKEDLDGVIAYAKELGLVNCIVPMVRPGAELSWGDAWKQIADEFNEIAAKITAAGLVFGYHNHSFEYEPKDGVRAIDVLYNNTDHNLVKLQLDTCWVENTGTSAIETMKLFAPALKFLHIKELTAVGDPTALPVGDGCIDFPPIINLGKELGVEWYVIEHEDRTTDADVLYRDIGKGAAYLKTLL